MIGYNVVTIPHKYRPLPNRTNIVITRQTNYKADGCVVVNSVEAALEIEINEKNLELIGNIDLAEICITSLAEIKKTNSNEIIVKTTKAKGDKCHVCWKINTEPCPRHG